MPSNREEIIADIKGHVGKLGGGFGDWQLRDCGKAKMSPDQ